MNSSHYVGIAIGIAAALIIGMGIDLEVKVKNMQTNEQQIVQFINANVMLKPLPAAIPEVKAKK